MEYLTDLEKQAIVGALNKYIEIENLPQELKETSITAKEKIKMELKKMYVFNK